MKRRRFFKAVIAFMLMSIGTFAADITIGQGGGVFNFPLATGRHDARTQAIYLASEIGNTKLLNSLAVNVIRMPGQVMNNFTIRLKHTDLSAFSTGSVWDSSDWTIVYQTNQTILTTGWVKYTFNTPFAYNGIQNLMVDMSFDNTSYTTDGYCFFSSSSTKRSIVGSSNSTNGDPLTWTGISPISNAINMYPNIQFSYEKAIIPNVIGMTQTAAQTALNTAGFNVVNLIQEFSYSVPKGNIISQSPIAGTWASIDSSIDLTVSLGIPITVPDVTGFSRKDAQSAITSAGLVVGTMVLSFNDSVPPGRIAAQSPVEGPVSIGTAVNLVVSLGEYYSGSGTSETPFQISSKWNLLGLSVTVADYDKCFIMTADIDMTGESFETAIIAPDTDNSKSNYQGTVFTGKFDGNGHKIINFTINGGSNDYLGLFGSIGEGGNIKNLGLENFSINASGAFYAGGLAGSNYYGSIDNCYSIGTIIAYEKIGGLVGTNSMGDITNCFTVGDVSGNSYIGGLGGNNSGGGIFQCYSTCDVNGSSSYVGGLIGKSNSRINRCYATGNVNGSSYVGGLLGYNTAYTINQCSSSGKITGNSYVGGLVGYNDNAAGCISYCYSTGQVNGSASSQYVGGLLGYSYSYEVSRCYSSGTVMGYQYVGGLIGYSKQSINGNIDNCYSISPVNGYQYISGLIGYLSGNTVRNCYSAGVVYGSADTGGLVGYNTAGIVTNSFWDIQTSNCTISAGGTGKTTAELMMLSTFSSVGWDFEPAWIDSNWRDWILLSEGKEYPKLIFQNSSYSYHGGSGTFEDPYLVADVNDIQMLSDDIINWDKHFLLIQNINLEGRFYSAALIAPGTISRTDIVCNAPFTGIFDGGDHTITNLCINGGSNDYLGLFGYVGPGGQISNLGLENYSVTSSMGSYHIGGLVGYNMGAIINCRANGSISGTEKIGGLAGHNMEPGIIRQCHTAGSVSGNYSGGLVGWNDYGLISDSSSACNVVGISYIGGLLGYNYYRGNISNCFSTGTVTGTGLSGAEYVGGLVGYNGKLCNIVQCYSTGIVSSISLNSMEDTSRFAGGLAGYNEGSNIINCYSTGAVSGNSEVGGLLGYNKSGSILGCHTTGNIKGASEVGGLVGWNVSSSIKQCYSSGSIAGGTVVGGLAGANGGLSPISESYATGNVTGSQHLGGLVGDNYYSDLVNCYATGSVSGTRSIGGLVGHHFTKCTVSFCYSTGLVSGTSYVGGLVGDNQGDSTCIVSGSFWDTQTSGLATSDGGTGKTTAEMQTLSTFTSAGWDFVGETTNGMEGIWFVREGIEYPRFVWENQRSQADAGEDITVYLGFESKTIEVTLDGSGSSDDDGDELTYKWYEGDTLLSEEINPIVSLPTGEHTITLIVNDGMEDSPADEVIVHIVGPVWANMRITPSIFSINGSERFVWAILDMPDGITFGQLDRDFGYFMLPGNVSPMQFWHINGARPQVIARFEREQLKPYLDASRMRLTFYGRLKDGRYIGGGYRVWVIILPEK